MIVLPMAGLSSRFIKAGYRAPKYMLELGGRSVFTHALTSFEAFFDTEQFLIICRNTAGTPAFVCTECAAAGLAPGRLKLVVLDAETSGQAETVALGLDRAGSGDGERLTIFNIDTFRPGFRHPDAFDPAMVDGYVEVFRAPGEHWSFVRPDPSDPGVCRAIEVAEKVRISDLCSTGLYHFRTVGLFRALYAGIAAQDPATLQGGERYIAPLYNTAIREGRDIRYSLIPKGAVAFCGTPAEYEALLSQGYPDGVLRG